MANELARRIAMVYGVERPLGRQAAVALAEAGADVALVTLSEDTAAEFAANSTANELWAIDRKGIVLTTDGRETTLREAIADATTELGPLSILVFHAHGPVPREALSGLLAAAGLRANALVASRALGDAAGPVLKEHKPPQLLDFKRAAVYLASDVTAAVEGAMVVAE
jgi:NAD(P)-dependent dehydrogenase (short-subunit alcohol dehydrogenase family)